MCLCDIQVQAAVKRQWMQYKTQWGQRRKDHCSMRSTSYTATSITEVPAFMYHHDCNTEHLNGRHTEDSELVALKSGDTYAWVTPRIKCVAVEKAEDEQQSKCTAKRRKWIQFTCHISAIKSPGLAQLRRMIEAWKQKAHWRGLATRLTLYFTLLLQLLLQNFDVENLWRKESCFWHVSTS